MKKNSKKPLKNIIKSPESVRRKKRSMTDTKEYFSPKTPLPDPFRAIDKGSSKLQPIILKSRCSPIMFESKISIRIPEITLDGKIRANKRILPALTPRPTLSNSPEAKYDSFYRRFSEKLLVGQSYQIDSLRIEDPQLDVSFGKNGSV